MPASSEPLRSIVGGWTVPYRRLAPLTRRNVSYPLGRLDVYQDRLVFRARGPLRFLTVPRVVPLAAITTVERTRGPIGRPSGVRVYHRADRTTWASRGRDSETWLVEYIEDRCDRSPETQSD